ADDDERVRQECQVFAKSNAPPVQEIEPKIAQLGTQDDDRHRGQESQQAILDGNRPGREGYRGAEQAEPQAAPGAALAHDRISGGRDDAGEHKCQQTLGENHATVPSSGVDFWRLTVWPGWRETIEQVVDGST